MHLAAKQPVIAGEPLLHRLEVGLNGGEGILQLQLRIDEALFIERSSQLAGTLHQFFQPAAGAFDAGRGGAVIPGDGGQVVRFVQHIDALVGRRQDDATTHGEVREQQRVVDYQHVGRIHVVAGAVEGAVLMMGQGLVAGVAIGGDTIPTKVGNGFGPVVPITIPLAFGVGLP